MRQQARKRRVTLSLNDQILTAVDRLVKSSHRTRSSVVESVLEEWYEQELRERLSQQAAEYYRSLTDEERREDEAIARFSTRAAKKIWADEG